MEVTCLHVGQIPRDSKTSRINTLVSVDVSHETLDERPGDALPWCNLNSVQKETHIDCERMCMSTGE